ncbi:MAG: stage IV sporulation protein A, partial [Oscillospiraceae bacterium]
VLEYSKELEEKWGVKVLPLNCMSISAEDISDIMEKVLFEFPLKELGINIPGWVESLPETHPLRVGIRETVLNAIPNIFKISDVTSLPKTLADYEYIEGATTKGINAGEGVALLDILVPDECFYQTVHDVSGFEIRDKQSLMTLMQELSDIKHKYDKISAALTEVAQKGYGIVSPGIDELTLEEPEIVKQGSRFGVRLKASAPSIHMIRADIQTEVSPIVGTERQSEELVHYLLNEFEQDPKKIWESNIFGKSLHELVNEGLHNKLNRMPEDAQMKLQETLQRIINEGSGGLICIIL